MQPLQAQACADCRPHQQNFPHALSAGGVFSKLVPTCDGLRTGMEFSMKTAAEHSKLNGSGALGCQLG